MITAENTEEPEVKRTSKLTAMLAQENEGFNGLQISVYYSENNWESCEEVNLILDENATISQLKESALYQFKTELSHDNIDQKEFNVMLFKKKKKIPNDEYPLCNPESKVKDYGKDQFCLIEISNSKKKDTQIERKGIKKEVGETNGNIEMGKIGMNNNDIKEVKQVEDNEEYEGGKDKDCSSKCKLCEIF